MSPTDPADGRGRPLVAPVGVAGATAAALAVMAGAFGAHGLEGRLAPPSLELWDLASRYLVIAAFGALGAALVGRAVGGRLAGAAGLVLLAGGAIFSGTLFGLALGGPSWLGAVTPVGGSLLILGFVLLAVAAREL